MLAADNIKMPSLSNMVTVTVKTQPYHTVFHFRHSSLIITLYCTYEVDGRCFALYWAAVLFTKTALDIKFLFYPSDAATHRTNRHPQNCIHTELRDQNHLLC